MKQIAIGLALSLALVNSAQAENSLPEIEVVNTDNQRWHFRQVTVNHTAAELTVFGRMDAHLRYGLPRGHVDIAAWSADNELIAETTTDYSPRLLTRRAFSTIRTRHLSQFSGCPDDFRDIASKRSARHATASASSISLSSAR